MMPPVLLDVDDGYYLSIVRWVLSNPLRPGVMVDNGKTTELFWLFFLNQLVDMWFGKSAMERLGKED
ncbi:hypothetical protein [Litchfieldella qijiaojingensis]|uniref:hypothetical protein n=1 Tax=Litchfieldella qijiaojingensis TaxID=980347 RepID=UPI001677D812|nr:hypothetical protein [Halomonas qijiaojingensis]